MQSRGNTFGHGAAHDEVEKAIVRGEVSIVTESNERLGDRT